MPPKTYAQLRDNEKCLYHAFGEATGETHATLGGFVNTAHFDADDTAGALILAKQYGFSPKVKACRGKDMKALVNSVEESTCYIVMIEMPPAKLPKKFDDLMGTSADASEYLISPAWDEVEWHALCCKVLVEPGGRTIDWYDAGMRAYNTVRRGGGQRTGGPTDMQKCVWWAKSI